MSRADDTAHPTMMQTGLTIREHFAAMAMQGLISRVPHESLANPQDGAIVARHWADALIAELAKPVTP